MAKTVYFRDRGGDRILRQLQEQVKQWGRWELSNIARDADLVLVLNVETKTVGRFSSLEEPAVTQPAEEYEVRTLTAQYRKGCDLATFSTRFGRTPARDPRELVKKFKDLIQKSGDRSTKLDRESATA